MKNHKPILLIEDDKIDAMMVKRALSDIEVNNELVHLENGEEALDYLKNKSNPRPCIILLDLNMPRMNGLEFLEIAKKEDDIRAIPVIILTTSTEHQDKNESFNRSVAGYMVKPVDYHEFVELMKTISSYWSSSELPQ